jgi:hypothetical protein
MSACSSTVRAVSRSRIPPLKTLLPFLYQTTTIQQCRPATRPIARRTITSRTRLGDRDDIPFVDENLPPPIDQEPARKTTITSTERAAFQKLYRKFNTEGRQQKEKDHIVELDQIADEYYEDDEENSKPSLDELFAEAMKGEPWIRTMRTVAQQSKMDAQLAKENTFGTELGKARSSKRKGAGLDMTQLREMRLAERARVDKLLRTAPTDRDLWEILEREVLTKVRALDLDNANTGENKTPAAESSDKKSKGKPFRGKASRKDTTRPKSTTKPGPPSLEQRVLFQNYPYHLVTAVATLRSEFPSSQLPLSILPTIKSLGRSSYVLGATTALYKLLLRTAWVQQSSFATIDTLLTEMDNNAIEFDVDVLEMINAILKEHSQAKSGIFGREIQLAYSMELFADDISKISTWKKTIAERLGLISEEARMHNKLVRRIPLESRDGEGAPVSEGSMKPQRMETQGDAFNTFEGNSETKGGARDDSQLAGGAESSSTDVDKVNEAASSAGGDAVPDTDGQEGNSTAVEESIEQRRDTENDDALHKPAKITS